MKKFFFRGLKIISLLVIIGLALFYFNQEKLIFHPHQLEKEYQFTFFLNPTKIQEVLDVADAGATMPQKSTFFYPKLISGLVMYKFE